MPAEIRVGVSGLPDEEWRKLPFLLKWVTLGMTEDVGNLRMAEEDEAVDFLLVDIDQGRGDASGAARWEIPVAWDVDQLPNPSVGITYPLRVADLQKRLGEMASASSGAASAEPAPGKDPEAKTVDPGGNPEAGPAATNVEQLLTPLLDPQPDTILGLQGVEGVDLVVSPDRGYYSPLAAGEFAWIQGALGTARWQVLDEALVKAAPNWKPISQLVWLLAFYGARDGLLPRVPSDGVFSLAGWPDFQIVPVAANSLRFWAYLASNTADVATIAEATGLDQGEVLGSLNGGYLCGLVKVKEGTEAAPNAKTGPDKGLLGKIRRRLGLSPVPSDASVA